MEPTRSTVLPMAPQSQQETRAPQSQQSSLPRHSVNIQFNPSERWAVSGKTGEGKTVFERWWLQHWYSARWPIVIIDIKRKFAKRFAAKPEDATVFTPYCIDATADLVPGCKVMLYHPTLPGWKDERLNRLLLRILSLGNIVLAFDEVNGVANEHSAPMALSLIWTQGRESNIPCMACFQKPVRIPVDLIEQAEWFAVYRVNNPVYRKKLVEMTGFQELIERPAKYYYWLAYESWERPVLMAPVPWDDKVLEAKTHGTKTVGASGSRLLDTVDQERRQEGRKVSSTPERRQARARKNGSHAATAYKNSRIHARGRGSASA